MGNTEIHYNSTRRMAKSPIAPTIFFSPYKQLHENHTTLQMSRLLTENQSPIALYPHIMLQIRRRPPSTSVSVIYLGRSHSSRFSNTLFIFATKTSSKFSILPHIRMAKTEYNIFFRNTCCQ